MSATYSKFAWFSVAFVSGAFVSGAGAQLGLAAGPAPSASTRGERVDLLGDPLPPGALLRLGTSRFQAPQCVQDLVLSSDEKTLVTIGGVLIAWDITTGKQRWEANANEAGYRTIGSQYGGSAVAFAP